jgi:predicted NBD/HSP70 family sugar kinase
MQTPKGNQELIRNHNRGLVINLLRTSGPMSRTDLARRTGLAPSALTRLIRTFLAEGVVEEIGKTESNGGRRAILISFNPHYAYTIGVKVERCRLLAARVDLAGQICARHSIALEEAPQPERIVEQIAEAVAAVRQGRTLGAGIAISGFVDAARGVDLFSPLLEWRDVPLGEPLARLLELPVWVENDVNALTLAECWHGAGHRFRNFVCITVGEGIGAGVVIGGELYRGAFGGAGEVGHITINPDGPRCRCGEQGCLEVYASDQFLRKEANRLGFLEISDLATAAHEGDARAKDVFLRMGRYLGIGVKNVVNLLNPEAIVLGGERMDAADLFLPSFEEAVRHHSFPEEAKQLEIIPAELGPDGFLIGAATLVTAEFFRLPTERM